MAVATDLQVQVYVNTRVRVRAEQIRKLLVAINDDKGAIDDIYAACVQAAPTWTDTRTDGPPRLLTAQDVLNFNAAISLLAAFFAGTATTQDSANFASNWNTLRGACVQPVGV